MMLKNNVRRGDLFYNTWGALVLLQMNTVVVSRLFDSAEERFKNKVLLIERSSSENNLFRLYLSYIVPVFRRRQRRGNTASLATAAGKCKCSGGGGGITSYAQRNDTIGR